MLEGVHEQPHERTFGSHAAPNIRNQPSKILWAFLLWVLMGSQFAIESLQPEFGAQLKLFLADASSHVGTCHRSDEL